MQLAPWYNGSGQDFALTYNQANRLAQIGQLGLAKVQYVYNAQGERVVRTLPGTPPTTTHFHFDRDGRLLAESSDTGAVIREYVWLDELPLAAIDSGSTYFIHADHLGTPQAITDGTQAIV